VTVKNSEAKVQTATLLVVAVVLGGLLWWKKCRDQKQPRKSDAEKGKGSRSSFTFPKGKQVSMALEAIWLYLFGDKHLGDTRGVCRLQQAKWTACHGAVLGQLLTFQYRVEASSSCLL
jgi:hypothetical protein